MTLCTNCVGPMIIFAHYWNRKADVTMIKCKRATNHKDRNVVATTLRCGQALLLVHAFPHLYGAIFASPEPSLAEAITLSLQGELET